MRISDWSSDVCSSDLQDAADVSTLLLASTSAPFADRQNAGIVKEALTLPDAVLTLDVGTSQKAGTGALIQAFRSADSGRTLVAASEKRRARPASEAELANGDAAAALLLGPGQGLATFIGTHLVSAGFVAPFPTRTAQPP